MVMTMIGGQGMSSTGAELPAKTAWRGSRGTRDLDRYLYSTLAGILGLLIFAGFARSYYLKFLFATPPLPSLVVHAHGVVMTAWAVLFSVQVGLVSTRRVRVHQRLGYLGIIARCGPQMTYLFAVMANPGGIAVFALVDECGISAFLNTGNECSSLGMRFGGATITIC